MPGQERPCILQVHHRFAVHGDYPVPMQEAAGVGCIGRDGIHDKRDGQIKHARGVQDLPETRLVDIDVQGIGPAENRCLADVTARQIHLKHPEILGLVVVQPEDPVSAAETHLIGQLIDIHGIAVIFHIGTSPDIQNKGIGQDGKEEVIQDPARHHQQALPGIVRPELPGLGFLLHGFRVQGFVDHAGDLAVAAEGQPPDPVLGLPFLRLREQPREPAPAGGEEFHAAHVEEQEELLHADMEEFGKGKMPQLMDDDEQGKGQDDLECLDKDDHIRLRAWT